jgi:hypothetical protein
MEVMKTAIIAKSVGDIGVFAENGAKNYVYNLTLYNSILRRIGENSLKKLDNGKRFEAVRKVIPNLTDLNNAELIDEKARAFVRTFNAVNSIKLIDWKGIIIITASLWMPETLLLIRRLLMSNMYKKEVIKLENIFELLGSIRGFKTGDVIREMAGASKIYRRHLEECMTLFKTERELALECLKLSVSNSRFSRLVDVMRVYALIDKEMALQILERNKLEKEEEIMLTAEEDVDIVDVIAFISITPVLLELANLLMKPMLDMVYDAFKYI